MPESENKLGKSDRCSAILHFRESNDGVLQELCLGLCTFPVSLTQKPRTAVASIVVSVRHSRRDIEIKV